MEHAEFLLGAKAVIRKNDQALILKSTRNDGSLYWDLPGGRLSPSDTSVKEGLVRELQEELEGIRDISIQRIIHGFTFPDRYTNGKGLAIMVFEVTATLPKIVLSPEHVEHKWVNTARLTHIQKEDPTDFPEGFFTALKLSLV